MIGVRFLLLVSLFLLSGCAGPGGFAGLRTAHDALLLDARLLERPGPFPAGTDMAPDVALVSFRYTPLGEEEARRDTLRGPEATEAWLREWRSRQLPEVDFALSVGDVSRCSEGLIQDGFYRIKEPGAQGAPERQRYRMLWVGDGTGGWKVHRIWLEPDEDARVARVASGCRSLRQLALAQKRFTLEGGVLFGAAAMEPAMDAMQGAGWTYSAKGLGFPHTKAGGTGFGMGIRYRLAPAWSAQALLLQTPRTVAAGRTPDYPREPHLGVRERWVTALSALQVGPVVVGAGPALARVELDWEDGIGTFSSLEGAGSAETKLGVVARASLVLPLMLSLQPTLDVTWLTAGSVTAPGILDLAGFTLPVGRTTAGMGFSYRF